MEFVHLQVRSGYSFMKSTNTIEKLVATAKQKGFTALALTDEGVMHGAISFYQTCQAYGIKPILGLTAYVEIAEGQVNELLLLAKNQRGYHNLLRLSSVLQSTTDYIRKHDVEKYAQGCIGILPLYESYLENYCIQNDMTTFHEQVKEWQSYFATDDFYIGLADYGIEKQRRVLATIEQVNLIHTLPFVAINDVRYLREEDAIAYDCLQSIREQKKWSQQIEDKTGKNRHLRTNDEMNQLFGDWAPSSLRQASAIANRCHVKLDFQQTMLPEYPVPEGISASEYLRQLCYKGLRRRYSALNEQVKDRLAYELRMIEQMQFSDYFLIVWDFIRYAKQQQIVTGPGRGSAAGSLVAYLLGITDVDPIRYDLLFERFLNPERVTMPDIDIDFSDVKRDQVIQYVKDKYGPEHVAQIITFGTFGPRSILRELAKVMGIDQQEISYVLKFIPQTISQSIVAIVQESSELKSYIQQSSDMQFLFKLATKLEGLPRHASTHAAGVIISKDPLITHVPLTSGHDGVPLTQYAMSELEAIGLLKMDFLGLRNLTLMERITKAIYEQEGKTISFSQDDMTDERTFTLLRSGKTTGIFQLESKGMKDVLERLRPTHFEDIVAVNALYRPGPMEYIPTYIKRKHGKEMVTYPHPDLEPILNKTYGVLVYQEQIMQIANKVAGMSLGQADVLRRAVSKKHQDVMNAQRQSFITGCVNNGYEREVGEQLFEWIVRFSNYGFNRSHAVAYSMISYQLAYLKAHYPAYFMTQLMSSASHDKMASYIKEAKELGITILPPSINFSYERFTVEDGNIRMGLSAIKGISKAAVHQMIQVRKDKPFRNLFEFCRRVPLQIVNRSVMESLVLAGCFDEMYQNRASLLASLQQAIEQGELFSDMQGQESFFPHDISLDAHYVSTEPFDQLKQLSLEKEVLGFYVSSHPLATFRNQLRFNGYTSLQAASHSTMKRKLKAAVVVQELKVIRTKRGDPMAFATFSDEGGEIEGVLFPEAFRGIRSWLTEEMLVFIEGKLEERRGSMQWIVHTIMPFDKDVLQEVVTERLFVKIDDESVQEEKLHQMKQLAKKYAGSVPIIVHFPHKKETFQLSQSFSINPTEEALEQFKQLLGENRVVLK
ncbi:DNA polymerase III subunit alpha [Pontibacillus litoralis]|uniref:DNA polymerase III subunit alpha n=1 Tax=Pontibacillus litoralis JSM 072002 TaxID=1385512 RepID=A0A0A5HZS0_9BACI|nr:DNA polymerase III subunit alpha [Pontibacillus litoralis]KGX89102.1 DNA polymerase III subunit alpha [Pontibacillus litoralis JSM 072002]